MIDAVGMEAHGAPVGKLAQTLAGFLPDAVARKVMETAGVDRLERAAPRRSSSSGAAGPSRSPACTAACSTRCNMLQMFDKQLTLRMGQANVRRWVDDILPLLSGDDDPLGVDTFATHHVPLDEAPAAYEMFQKKEDGAFKIVFRP